MIFQSRWYFFLTHPVYTVQFCCVGTSVPRRIGTSPIPEVTGCIIIKCYTPFTNPKLLIHPIPSLYQLWYCIGIIKFKCEDTQLPFPFNWKNFFLCSVLKPLVISEWRCNVTSLNRIQLLIQTQEIFTWNFQTCYTMGLFKSIS